MLIGGILLIIIGFEGALGKVVAVAFSPGSLEYYTPIDHSQDTQDAAIPSSITTVQQFTI